MSKNGAVFFSAIVAHGLITARSVSARTVFRYGMRRIVYTRFGMRTVTVGNPSAVAMTKRLAIRFRAVFTRSRGFAIRALPIVPGSFDRLCFRLITGKTFSFAYARRSTSSRSFHRPLAPLVHTPGLFTRNQPKASKHGDKQC